MSVCLAREEFLRQSKIKTLSERHTEHCLPEPTQLVYQKQKENTKLKLMQQYSTNGQKGWDDCVCS